MYETRYDPSGNPSKTGAFQPLEEGEPTAPREAEAPGPRQLSDMPFDPSRTGVMPLITEFPDDDVRDDDTPDAPDGQ
ncbi:hypothetical protein G4Y79_09770 [Phototrophicus methaneseepsis]|uniref:Uncharacterized protein n=1 Tax=Phototrophicus methaneseepsis TaxID=2710758 RepID=A0A7S8IGF4_9CHLR|nr:hypothetical protein [Phototrophicus methaneseepsis]QPC84642.1 hypothetical protein G4Y79_09770 [Phototrophicus methaneseepsis]